MSREHPDVFDTLRAMDATERSPGGRNGWVKANMENPAIFFQQAVNYAAWKHKAQKRKGGIQESYINHPLGVSEIILRAGVGNLIVRAAAILHDVVEDTDATDEEISYIFGDEVADLVKEVSDNKSLPGWRRKELQLLHAQMREGDEAPEDEPHMTPLSYGARLIKGADKLYNCNELSLQIMNNQMPEGWSAAKCAGYFLWAQLVVNSLEGIPEEWRMMLECITKRHLTFVHCREQPSPYLRGMRDEYIPALLEVYLQENGKPVSPEANPLGIMFVVGGRGLKPQENELSAHPSWCGCPCEMTHECVSAEEGEDEHID